MGKPGPKATNIFQKLKLGNNSVKSMPKYSTSPVKKALKGNQNELPMELQAAIKAAPGKKLVTAKEKAGGSFDKPVGTPAGAEKRKQIIEKVRKEGEAKVSASAKKLKTPSPAKSIFNNKISEKRAKRKESKGKGRIEYKIGGGYYHNEETGERGYEPGHEPGGVHNRGRYVSNKGKVKAVGRKHKSHAKKKKSMAYKFKSNAQRKAAYASGYKGK
jgi:hypothetical protein